MTTKKTSCRVLAWGLVPLFVAACNTCGQPLSDAGHEDADAGGKAAGSTDAGTRRDADAGRGDGRPDAGIPTAEAPCDADSDADGVCDADEVALGTNPHDADSDGDGIRDGDELILGTSPIVADTACAGSSAQASMSELRPVDIIFVIDSSGSMDEEIQAVEDNINVNFAALIGASDIDYRIIMIAAYGDGDDICIREPLSGGTCAEPLPEHPANTATFYHYDEDIGSHDAFDKVLDTYDAADRHGTAPDGWRGWLRPGSVKVFVLISDDEPGEDHDWFDGELLRIGPEHFGSAAARNYVWHSIIGMEARVAQPASDPWHPSDGVRDQECSPGSESAATEYQRLSILTGGLRFSLCDHFSFDGMFQQIAGGVIEAVQLPCTLLLPTPPDGEELDLERAVLVYTPGDGSAPASLGRVEHETACAPGSYFFEQDRLVLCPDVCAVVQQDETGGLALHLACVEPDEPAPDGGASGCETCGDCAGQACIEGVCSPCTQNTDCCAFDVCLDGACVPVDG